MTPEQQTTAPSRDALIRAFLSECEWSSAVRTPIPGDASFRRYERIEHNGRSAILMDAPPGKEDVTPFITVSEYLIELGLRAPRLLARDTANGFLLLEDLGNDLFSRVLAAAPETARLQLESSLYIAATDVQVELYNRTRGGLPELPPYDSALLSRELALLTQWYLPAILGEETAANLTPSYESAWAETLDALPDLPAVPTLRDYHADNLLVIAGLTGMDAVGLLDFQDAVLGSPAYDMVSFLEDARRDVSAQTVRVCKEHYIRKTGLNAEAFDAAYAILGAQRNCKIIGIFTRLGVRDGKYRYQHYLPRVWAHLRGDLTHPALAPVARWMNQHVPAHWQNGAFPYPDRL